MIMVKKQVKLLFGLINYKIPQVIIDIKISGNNYEMAGTKDKER